MTPKDKQIKKKHHHVWDHYIRRWSDDKKNVWHTTSKGNVAYGSAKGLAREDHFYQIHHISPVQAEVIKGFSSKSPKRLHKQHIYHLNLFLKLQDIEQRYKDSGKQISEFEELINVRQNNMLEDLHTKHEADARTIIDALANHNLSILYELSNKAKFMMYFGHQMSRTKTFKETLAIANRNATTPAELLFSDTLRECWWFMSYMFGMSLGTNIFISTKDAYQCLLINNTEEPFITSDQPIVNVHACTNQPFNKLVPPKYADFFYPISPTVGYMINDSTDFGSGKVEVDIETVRKLNTKLARQANIHIFGSSEQMIKQYKGFVGTNYKRVIKGT